MASKETPHITLIGAGLAGSLLAILLAQKGLKVDVYEKRPDPRKQNLGGGRSINLALSARGIRALQKAGIGEEILQEAIPMRGRMLHNLGQDLQYVPYGKNDKEYINSISRSGLNARLITLADAYPEVSFYFNQECQAIDWENKQIQFADKSVHFERIIGSDGAGSVLRKNLSQVLDLQESTDFLSHGYKELSIPPNKAGGFQLEKEALHIWPRNTYMLIALPNLDGSFTCTLFLENEGNLSFASLANNPSAVQSFFEEQFPDALALMPNLAEEFAQNPVGLLGTVRCAPWHYQDQALLLGDAAHAIVPFYGQGMNASFEDCLVLIECLEELGNDWQQVFAEYEKRRKINADAIADLAIENFYEMREQVNDPTFLKKRQLEHLLENQYPDYHSKYSLVTFNPEISYQEARLRGNQQNDILLKICEQNQKPVESYDLAEIYALIRQEVEF